MGMIKTVIIEDEKPAARKLERMLGLFPDLQIVANLESVEEAVEWFSGNVHPQLIFSDIVLGDGLSFDIFDKISTKAFIIYTTAFDQYTLKAFKLNSIDYLLKPLDESMFVKAVDKCLRMKVNPVYSQEIVSKILTSSKCRPVVGSSRI